MTCKSLGEGHHTGMTDFNAPRRCPVPYEPALGAEARALFLDLPKVQCDLIEGAAGCSPYLKGLMAKEADWLVGALRAPEASLDTVLADLEDVAPKGLGSALRQAKRRVALLAGLADLAGVWTLEQVTEALTRLADRSVSLALRAALRAEIARGKLPGMTEADLADAGGMVVLAMGKMGAHELNYSSDIDLICLFDETRFARDDYHDARASFVRATRRMAAMLNDITGEGYVFRTDLRLRPDPAVTPVCMAMEAAERYYESLGRTWERAAYIKARVCAGDFEAGARFLKTLTPFVWRKHLDFAAIQDAHDMRLAYREHKGTGGAMKVLGHNMKLGRGGIREIEFFTQTRQIIAGGRDAELRVKGTVDGLAALAGKGWITRELADTLTDHYRFHREVEHRLQMLRDAQTHSLPASEAEFERLAAFMGRAAGDLADEIKARLEEVHGLTEGFFAPDDTSAQLPDAMPAFDAAILDRWQSYPALRSERANEIFARLRPEILSRLGKSARPEDALQAFDGFLAGLPAGVQLFSLFDANPQLIDLLIDIVGTAPALARYLSRNSGVFDAVIAGGFFEDWPGRGPLVEELSALLAREPDYERKLDAARRWAKEWHFGIGVHHLRGLARAEAAGGRYADLAEAILQALLPEVEAQFALKHGPLPGRGAVVLGMGSLGAGRLTATSDLDLILIYDADGGEMSEGKRPLPVRQYYARLTQAMVTALSAPMAEGRLYEVDMRLRPSGTQGPVATSWQSFSDYQQNKAWIWEHLALTRARVVAGSGSGVETLSADVEALRAQVIARPVDGAEVLQAVAEMRARIAAAKQGGPWEAKIGAGRLQDVELFGQAGLLMAGSPERGIAQGLGAALDLGSLTVEGRAALAGSYDLFWTLQSASKLLSETGLDGAAGSDDVLGKIGEGGARLLLREAGFDTLDALRQGLEEASDAAAQAIAGALVQSGG
jgi:glutamate-ammonia-ligase adenylyltransferase